LATIASSTIIQDQLQKDGRRDIVERHVDSAGLVYLMRYLAPDVAWNAATVLAARAISLGTSIVTKEIENNINQIVTVGSLAVIVITYSTPAANFAALRAAYGAATRHQAIYIADFLSTLTDAQLQAAFGLTAPQVTTLRTSKLTPAVALASSIRASAGQ
jgi:hypothetical protein